MGLIGYELTRSKRKSIAVSVREDLRVIVRAPLKMPLRDIEGFVVKHSAWIEKHKLLMEQRKIRQMENQLSGEQRDALRQKAREVLPQRVAYFSAIIGVEPTGVKVTSAVTRWGSCSAKNSLCFSYRVMLLPNEIIDYIIVHELTHIKVKNHSAAFYSEISKYQPDYKERIIKLKQIQRELPR